MTQKSKMIIKNVNVICYICARRLGLQLSEMIGIDAYWPAAYCSNPPARLFDDLRFKAM